MASERNNYSSHNNSEIPPDDLITFDIATSTPNPRNESRKILPSPLKRDFDENFPLEWLEFCEATLSHYNINDSADKYQKVTERIPLHHLSKLKVPTTVINKFEQFKTNFYEKFSLSTSQKIRKLLQHTEIGDKKPSQFLEYIQQILPNDLQTSREVLKEIFLAKLPRSIYNKIIPSMYLPLDQLAAIADRTVESESGMINALTPSKYENDKIANLERAVASLTENFAAMQVTLNEIAANQNSAKEHARSRARSKSPIPQTNPQICYYHIRFGKDSFKCNPPCNFRVNNKYNNNNPPNMQPYQNSGNFYPNNQNQKN